MNNSLRSVSFRVVAIGTGLVIALAGTPAHAATKVAPKISIGASKVTVNSMQKVQLAGKVTRKSAGAKVRIQKRTAHGTWTTVRTTKVTKKKRYAVTVRPQVGKHTYRALVVANHKFRSSASRTISINAVIPPPAAAPVTAPAATSDVQTILDDTNANRAAFGKSALKLSSSMSQVATAWAQHLSKACTLAHNPNYSRQIPGGWTKAAENAAAGYPADSVVSGWMGSAGHRKNLLGDYTHIGIGHIYNNATSSRCASTYSIQVFAKY